MKTPRSFFLRVALAAAFLGSSPLAPFAHAQTDTQQGSNGANGGNGSGFNGNGGNGGSPGPAPNGSNNPVTATASGNSSIISATAGGGSGGSGGRGGEFGGIGASGSSASASATTTAGFTGGMVTASATGGNGGDGGDGGNGADPSGGTGGDGGAGGAGGNATASATASGTGDVTVTAIATAGAGGSGGDGGTGDFSDGLGADGSNGGTASLAASSVSGTSTNGGAVQVTASAIGGAAGSGGEGRSLGGSGGDGGSVSLTNAVIGSTTGTLTLTQNATGGSGGRASAFVGTAGSASSTINQTLLAPSQLSATTTATGGAGGERRGDEFASGGDGGDAVASTILTGSNAVFSTATATGGLRGSIPFSSSETTYHGAARATAQATSNGGGPARAIANITSGAAFSGPGPSAEIFAAAQATTNNPNVGAIRAVRADTGITLAGTSIFATSPPLPNRALGNATLGPGQTYNRGDATLGGGTNAGALIQGAPSAADVADALATHPNVAAAFLPPTTELLARASLGTGRTSEDIVGSAQAFSSSVTLTLDSAQLALPPGGFQIGLLDPIVSGNGFDAGQNPGLRFRLQINGVTVVDQSFTDIAIANSYFTDQVLEIGDVPGGISTLTALLDMTTRDEGDGYNIEFLVGNNTLIPEPSTYMLLGGGLLTLLGAQRVRRSRRPRLGGSGNLS